VLDVRDQSWDRPEVYEYWRALGVGCCTTDQPQVSYAIGVTPVVIGPTGSLWRHGCNAAAGFAEDSDVAAR
jgi:hypothetical protein